jgi:uncharacterized membrane protein
MKKILLFLVVVVAMISHVAGQQLKYCPKGVKNSSFQQFVENIKKDKVEVSFVTVENNKDEHVYKFAFFRKDYKAIVIFDIGTQSYIIGVHEFRAQMKDDFAIYCEYLSYPIELDKLEEVFGASVVPFTEINLKGWKTILTD